jgi:uncharacterized protein (TIGR02145 family)
MMKQYLIILVACMLSLHSVAQQYGSFKDSLDGKVYKTVKIGEQEWMAENLNTYKFSNGDPILEANSVFDWSSAYLAKKPAWSYYKFDPKNAAHGKIYNWYAMIDPRGLAPQGWSIPNLIDCKKLLKASGGDRIAALKLKSKTGWKDYRYSGGDTTIQCENCKNWNNEYRRKVPCHVCQDNRYFVIKRPVVYRTGNGNNLTGFNAQPNPSVESDGISTNWWYYCFEIWIDDKDETTLTINSESAYISDHGLWILSGKNLEDRIEKSRIGLAVRAIKGTSYGNSNTVKQINSNSPLASSVQKQVKQTSETILEGFPPCTGPYGKTVTVFLIVNKINNQIIAFFEDNDQVKAEINADKYLNENLGKELEKRKEVGKMTFINADFDNPYEGVRDRKLITLKNKTFVSNSDAVHFGIYECTTRSDGKSNVRIMKIIN